MAKQDGVIDFTTCEGRAEYPHVNEPDTKFKEEGEYNCKLFMAASGVVKFGDEEISVEEFEKRLDKQFDAAVAKARKDAKNPKAAKAIKEAVKPWGWVDPCDADGNPNGAPAEFYISSKMKASGVSKKTGKEYTMRPTLYDSGNDKRGPKDITKTCGPIGSGSILRIGGQAADFLTGTNAGVTIRLNAVQVIEIREGGGRTAESFGFGAREGGFSHDGEAVNKPAGKSKSNDVGMDDDDDQASDDPDDGDDDQS